MSVSHVWAVWVCVCIVFFFFHHFTFIYKPQKSNWSFTKRFLREKLWMDLGLRFSNFSSETVQNCPKSILKNGLCYSLLMDLGQDPHQNSAAFCCISSIIMAKIENLDFIKEILKNQLKVGKHTPQMLLFSSIWVQYKLIWTDILSKI